jgi:pimeloyl-ACP methyl ester carboxylesterase
MAMYGKVLHDSTVIQRQRSYQFAQQESEQEAANMRAKGSNAAQVQMYLDQQRLRLKATMRRDEESLVKHQRAMLEIVRQTPDNAQAQAILSNMLRQYYPAASAADVQATAQLLTSPAYRSYLSFDPQPALAQVHCPVLLLQGENDAEVNPATNLTLLKKGLRANQRVTELRLPGLSHALQTSPGAEVAVVPSALADINSWLKGQK